MRINRIELFNVGPYEEYNEFDIALQNKGGHVVVIGGKNGAGKTTLFSAIKLCLYGYKNYGYETVGVAYKKNIQKLINDKAKAENNPKAYVRIDIDIFNGQEWDNYVLTRAWNLAYSNFEEFDVLKNNLEMSENEILDFENYLLELIPPELFELYFFDGEEIADYFLEDKGNDRIKNAFLTICGYDTFDIILKNFKRIGKGTETSDDTLTQYLDAEDAYHDAEVKLKKCNVSIEDIKNNIENEDAMLEKLEAEYKASGGVTQEQWNDKFIKLKNEERFRDEKNTWLKNAANEMIPYIIVHKHLEKLLEQMEFEKEAEKSIILKESISALLPGILVNIGENHPELTSSLQSIIRKEVSEQLCKDQDNEMILDLSNDEYRQLSNRIAQLLSYDKAEIIKVRKEVKKSIIRSQKIRDEIESSHVDDVKKYLDEKEKALQKKCELIKKHSIALDNKKELEINVQKAQVEYFKREKEFEKKLKNDSIGALTSRSILFLETLQKRLLESELRKVENLFMEKMSQLMRKERFIDDIHIDENFAIHVYKTVILECKGVCEKIKSMSVERYIADNDSVHLNSLLLNSGCASIQEFLVKYANNNSTISALMEFDKTTMSKGERQVFIMSLYWAMMQLSNKEVPFVIDTPFARIDTIHRENITKHFFKELKGQVFIFSTDEEINDNHIEYLGDDLAALFMIENVDNTKTVIKNNEYFIYE